ncbi:MAG: universal stress protein [Deltaproteobacteria bacterium]|nr:universal stress protein [Deltaproteobacteria bacterium]
MEIKKILYATDLSTGSQSSFHSAMEIAKKFDACLVILHVIEELPPSTVSILQWVQADKITKKHYDDFKAYSVDQIRASIQEICDKEITLDPTCRQRVESIHVVIGYPADEILNKLDELNCDAVIMGTHSKGAIAHTFLGSVAERVLRRVKKPAFVFPSA